MTLAAITTVASWARPALRAELGFIPSEVWRGARLWSIVTALFVHEGALHFAVNALALVLFGARAERALGSLKASLALLACGVGAFAIDAVADPSAQAIRFGASGLAAGGLGLALGLAPEASLGVGPVRVPLLALSAALVGAQLADVVAHGLAGPAIIHLAGFALGGVVAGAHHLADLRRRST